MPRERLQIQWGHGAPGVVISLQSALPAYQNFDPEFASRIEAAIDRAQQVIWQKGLLRKESCLCHGAAGNMLALTDRRKRAFSGVEHGRCGTTEEQTGSMEDGPKVEEATQRGADG